MALSVRKARDIKSEHPNVRPQSAAMVTKNEVPDNHPEKRWSRAQVLAVTCAFDCWHLGSFCDVVCVCVAAQDCQSSFLAQAEYKLAACLNPMLLNCWYHLVPVRGGTRIRRGDDAAAKGI